MTPLKECSHFLSRLLYTSFFKLWNDELAFQVRVVPQIKCSVTLVSFLCVNIWSCLVHGKKEVGIMQTPSLPSAPSFHYVMKPITSGREMKLISQQLHLPRLVFMSRGLKAMCGQLSQSSAWDSALNKEG